MAAELPTSAVIGVTGAGAMGAGIAQVAAAAGHPVLLFDMRSGAASAAIDAIRATFDKLVSKGKLGDADAVEAKARLHAISSVEGFAGCALVIEAIVEDLDAKRFLFREVESVVDTDTLLATNTSSLSVTAIASALQHPERFAGMHFFNPAPLLPLVEIVCGASTSSRTADTLHATARAWGKTPVQARSTPGFIVNRVARPFYAEALRVLSEGGADVATIDAVIRDAGGFRMGPFELMDLIGNDINYAVTKSVFDAFYGDTRFTPSLLQRDLVDAGKLGRKTGRGFYDYAEDAAKQTAKEFAKLSAPTPFTPGHTHLLSATLAKRLHNIDVSVQPSENASDAPIAEAGGCFLYACDGRTATNVAASTGQRNVVLVDLALDFGKATRLALTAAEQAEPDALQTCAALLQSAGFMVSPVADVPGMIVLRTVAMLANEAADAVQQQVCTVQDCDLAMQKGVNYPRGPLAWADALSPAFVVRVLENMQLAYGEDRYRVSPLLRKKAESGTRFFPAVSEEQR